MVFSQKDILNKLRDALQSEGVVYHKKLNILAKKALGGERIVTITGDGPETSNQAREGDYIVQNQTKAGEQYVVPGEEFLRKYEPVNDSAADGFAEYRSLGVIVAIELTGERLHQLNLPEEFIFRTDWGEEMIAKEGDFMGGPADLSEVYRLARKEFFETYSR